MFIINCVQHRLDENSYFTEVVNDDGAIATFKHIKCAKKHLDVLFDKEMESLIEDEGDVDTDWNEDQTEFTITTPNVIIFYSIQKVTIPS